MNSAAPDGIAVKLDGVSKSFGDLQVLADVTLQVRQGSCLCVIGPSGSGKSTMIRCVGMLEKVSAGSIFLYGRDITRTSTHGKEFHPTEAELRRWRMDVGFVFQNFNLFGHMSALENVLFGPVHVKKLPKKASVERATELLNSVGLGHRIHQRPGKLSGGEQQRVAIARALAMDPKVLLFDEPTSALDSERVGEVLDVIVDLAKGGTTMIVVTHELEFARQVADEVVMMDEGRVVEFGPPRDVLSNPTSPRTKQFISRLRND